jgi:hypothetical protein
MFSPQNKFRYYATPRSGVTFAAKPTGEAELKLNLTKDRQNFKHGHAEKYSGQVAFRKDDFEKFYLYERSEFRCDVVDLVIERKCDGGWSPWLFASINLNDGDWDLDNCVVSFPLVESTPYDCYEKGKDSEYNILAEVPVKRTVKLTQGVIELYDDAEVGASGTCDTTPPTGDFWTIYRTVYKYHPSLGCEREDFWARETLTVNCAITPAGDWTLISDDCGTLGTRTYARPVTIYDCTFIDNTIGGGSVYEIDYERSCSVVGLTGYGALTIDNGVLLSEALQMFVNKLCPSLTVKSNFFQINPDIVSTVNYVTGQPTYTNQLILFQKSDVKRPNSTGNATKAVLTMEKLIKILAEMFNVHWVIEGSFIRFEHVSFFDSLSLLDLTVPKYKKWMNRMRRYSYDRQEQVSFEEFKFMEAQNADFIGKNIEYLTGCGADKTKKKTHVAEGVTTDLQTVMSHPSSDSSIVSDDGFVLVATEVIGGEYFVIRQAPILDTQARVNNVLGWAILHRDFHKHDRVHIQGMMNNTLTNFLSTMPTKKGVPIVIPYCCGDELNMNTKVKTGIGTGIIDKATINLRDETIELVVAYDTLIEITNEAPVANANAVDTVKDQCIIIDVLDNDTDDEPIVEVEVVVQPLHGTATVLPDKTIQYCPATDYVGGDTFIYRIRDSWGTWSNNALVSVGVADLPAVANAVNDTYIGPMNTPIVKDAANGVLQNDSGAGIVVTAGTFPTSGGGSITIAADGSFTYTPLTGFTGIDTVNYTITDSSAGTDTGTISFNIGGTVYVKAITDDIKTGLVSESCDGNMTYVGDYETRDFRVQFFSDAAGTIPMNVTGMGIVLNYKRIFDDYLTSSHVETSLTDNAAGFGQIIEDDYYYSFESMTCEGVDAYNYGYNYVILPGTNYTII